MKSEGVFICKSCKTQYTVEEARKLMIEGLVDVTGSTVKIDNSAKFDNLYKTARRAREDGDSNRALRIYEQLETEDPDNWEPVFFSAYYSALDSLENDNPGGSVRVVGGRVKLSIEYRTGISPCIRRIYNCMDSVFSLIENIENYDEQQSAVYEVSGGVMSVAEILSSVLDSEYERMKREIDHYARETTDPDYGFIGRGFSKMADGSSSQNKQVRASYKKDISEMVSSLTQQKIKFDEFIGKRRFAEFWALNQQLRVALEGEKQSLLELIARLNTEKLNTPPKIEGYADMVRLQQEVERLTQEMCSLGIFKFKEKNAVQERINATNHQIAPLQYRIDAAIAEIQQRIFPIQNRVDEIDVELTKPR
jgi:hypothetical protein